MVSSTLGLVTPSPTSFLTGDLRGIGSPAKSTPSTTSFSQQLATALEDFIKGQSGSLSRNDSPLGIEIQAAPVWNGPKLEASSRQFLVTVKDRSAIAAPLLEEQPPAIPSDPPTGPQNIYDAYWAEQPPEVQELRALEGDERWARAQELANKGFAIDVPIMVWKWDPLVTMTIRQNQGFTWVPCALMPPVLAGPGIDFPGAPAYDKDRPPAGSISVSTRFAKGLEHTCVWFSSLERVTEEKGVLL